MSSDHSENRTLLPRDEVSLLSDKMEDTGIGGSGSWERRSGDNFGGEREDEQTAGVPGRSLSATNNSRIQGIIIKILVFFTLRSILTNIT